MDTSEKAELLRQRQKIQEKRREKAEKRFRDIERRRNLHKVQAEIAKNNVALSRETECQSRPLNVQVSVSDDDAHSPIDHQAASAPTHASRLRTKQRISYVLTARRDQAKPTSSADNDTTNSGSLDFRLNCFIDSDNLAVSDRRSKNYNSDDNIDARFLVTNNVMNNGESLGFVSYQSDRTSSASDSSSGVIIGPMKHSNMNIR
ncbi:hypothetical protein QAD02_019882 [Eretmocerus hayati]|uniref:Uncharacterized protein n=1 Tax=Eretmocerus hayati TaxID=131215 RepID=A0ACC2PQM9_9HYME|nr:hypothetical protein QAD02_019882 [Eretmocerus hayati]